MNRRTATALVLCIGTEVAFAGPFAAMQHVDLNKPGALERIRDSNPSHYGIILQILDGLNQRQDGDVVRWIRANFQARAASFSPYTLTSYPAQKDLTFTLDALRYRARVTLAPGGALIVPASPTNR